MPSELQKKGIKWAESMLADAEKLKKLTAKEFAADDVDGSGALSMDEARGCVMRVCGKFHMPMPKEEKMALLFEKCDKNADHQMQEGEFGKFFKIVLESVVKKAKSASDEEWEAASAAAALPVMPETYAKMKSGGAPESENPFAAIFACCVARRPQAA